MLSIGDLDRRIIIESPTTTVNNYGETISTWGTAYTVWAKIDWKRSNRKEESQELVQISDLTFYIRNIGITVIGTYRISYDSKYYYVHGMKEVDGRKEFLELETKLKDNK